MSAHAILGPSGAYRWLTCTPSARFEEQIPNEDSEYAAEGTIAHDLAAHILAARSATYKKDHQRWLDTLQDIEDEARQFYESVEQDNGYVEMLDHAEGWAEFVKDFGGTILIEQRYDISKYAPLCFGTADATNITPRVLYVSDFKYGIGVLVKAEKNKQLMLYGLGALLKALEMGHNPETVVLSIYQPRAGGSSSWEISAIDLLEWAKTEVSHKAHLAIAGEGEFIPGDHCQFCRARNSCKAYFDKFSALLDIRDKRVMTDEDLALVLTYGPLIQPWYNKLKEEITSKLQRGKKLKGFKLVKGRGQRAFINEDNVIDILLGEGMDSETMFETKMKSLTAFEKIVGPKRFAEIFKNEIINKAGAPQIAPESDGRQAIGATLADEYDDEYEDLT